MASNIKPTSLPEPEFCRGKILGRLNGVERNLNYPETGENKLFFSTQLLPTSFSYHRTFPFLPPFSFTLSWHIEDAWNLQLFCNLEARTGCEICHHHIERSLFSQKI